MSALRGGTAAKILRNPAHHSRKIQRAEKNQHQTNGKLHREAEARRDHNSKQDNEGTDDKDSDGMAESPQNADESGAAYFAFAADNRRNGDDMVRVRSMAHSQEETERDDRKQRNHGSIRSSNILNQKAATSSQYRL